MGGPATTWGALIPEFLVWCRANDAPVDFVSTHVYRDDDDFALTDPTYRELFGRGEYLQTLVTRVADLPDLLLPAQPGSPPLEVHWTEWNTSWRWGRPIHDQANQAAFICQAIHAVRERVASFAFWTLSDIFNEFPYSAEALVGGFGLLTTDGLPKPGYHAYRLLHRLGSVELPLATDADAMLGSSRPAAVPPTRSSSVRSTSSMDGEYSPDPTRASGPAMLLVNAPRSTSAKTSEPDGRRVHSSNRRFEHAGRALDARYVRRRTGEQNEPLDAQRA